jgi:hypothetical protein
MLQVGEITENTDEDSRSNRRPIELIGSRPASDPRSRIAGPQSSKCDAAASCPHSIFATRLECCADQLSAPPKDIAPGCCGGAENSAAPQLSASGSMTLRGVST